MIDILEQILFKILTVFFGFEFAAFSFLGGIFKDLPKAPDDFKPILRFTVCSDNHLDGKDENNTDNFKKMFKQAYNYSDSSEYNKIDAMIFAGDFTNAGLDEEYQLFNSIVDEEVKEGTQVLTVLGNHEFIAYRDYDPTIGYQKYQQYENENVDTHTVINGYHFIGVSYSDDAKTFKSKTEWLTNELKNATAEDKDKPVFVYQHPQPFNTVYGSINWGDFDLKLVLNKFPQVVDFSGHSHYTATDPRSIWQGTFTAIGTGSTARLMGNLNYIEGDQDAPGKSASFWIVEVDKGGNIKLVLYDIINDQPFDTEYYLSDVSKQSAHKYTWLNMKSHDTAPVFHENAEINVEPNDDGTYTLFFPDADSFWGTEDYKISIKSGLKEKFSDTVISNYVRSVSEGMSVNIGNLNPGTYNVIITPYSPYAKGGSPLKGTITISET